jgi:hypothetical protein
MSEIEMLNAERARISNRIWAIEGKQRAAEHAKLLGKCFKYRNSYGGSSEADGWWLYVKVTKIDARGEMKAFQFQTDKYGKLEIEANYRIPSSLSSGYTPITAGEFSKAWRAVQKRVAGYRP